jgi:hypothetical protein
MASSESGERGDFNGWLWGDRQLSDITVRLITQPSACNEGHEGEGMLLQEEGMLLQWLLQWLGRPFMHAPSVAGQAKLLDQKQDVHCHKVVLCSGSPGYWRRRIMAWQPSIAPAALPTHPVAGLMRMLLRFTEGNQGRASSTSLLEEHCTHEELPACVAVLQHTYNGQLPQGADFALICWVGSLHTPSSSSCKQACTTVQATALLDLCTACRWR